MIKIAPLSIHKCLELLIKLYGIRIAIDNCNSREKESRTMRKAKRQRAIMLTSLEKNNEDMHHYLGRPEKRGEGNALDNIWLKPNNCNNYWLAQAVGRFASFGQRAIPGFWDEEYEEFRIAWEENSRKAAETYWPQAWKDSYGF